MNVVPKRTLAPADSGPLEEDPGELGAGHAEGGRQVGAAGLDVGDLGEQRPAGSGARRPRLSKA